MWHSLTQIIASRPTLTGKKEELEKFAKENNKIFSVIGAQFGDDITGLEWNGAPNELYISTFYVNEFVAAFLNQ